MANIEGKIIILCRNREPSMARTLSPIETLVG